MLKFRLLKMLRVIVSLLVLGWFCLAFSSFAPLWGEAAKGEFFPALLRVATRLSLLSLLLLLVIGASAFLAGRLYCSFGCPLGVLQDIAGRLGKLAGFGRWKYKPLPEWKRLRYGSLIVLVALALGGVIAPLGFLEPYSLFGRNANGPGQSLVIESNNLLYGHVEAIEPLEERPEFPWVPALISGGVLLAILGAAAYRGRVFCNTFCPAGALLGLCSKYALFPLRLDEKGCLKCGQCVKVCKAGCIDVRNKALDAERCVGCMNCGTVCKFGGVDFGRRPKKKKPAEQGGAATDSGRRKFLLTAGGVGIAAFIGARLIRWGHGKRRAAETIPPVMPPGADSRDKFLSRCTGCGICIANCTGRTLKPAFLEYGLIGMGQPVLSFETGKCEFNCRNCSMLCPTGALKRLTEDEKRHCRIGMVRYHREHCVVITDETDCGACAEHCPTGALQMVPYKDGLMIPQVTEELCIGCGGCEYICPALWGERDEKKAMMVYGVEQQTRASDPREVLKRVEPSRSKKEDFPF